MKQTRLNSEIRATEVRLIGAQGEQIGIVPGREALRLAQDAGFDLVEISPHAKPPVCRMMDYGKYLFEQGKKQGHVRKKQRQAQLKELKYRPGIEEGDYQVKLRNLIRFLENGDKVKITLRFRGREWTHQELGRRLMARLQEDIAFYGGVEFQPKLEGRQMVMVISPKKK